MPSFCGLLPSEKVFRGIFILLLLSVVAFAGEPKVATHSSPFSAQLKVTSKGLQVVEHFNAAILDGYVTRNMLWNCRFVMTSAHVNGTNTPFKAVVSSTPGHFSKILLTSVGGVTHGVVDVKLVYTLPGSVLNMAKDKSAVFFGLPPCSVTYCPQIHQSRVKLSIDGNATDVKALLHVPSDQYISIPVVGRPPSFSATTHVSHYAVGSKQTTTIDMSVPSSVPVRDTEPLSLNAKMSGDVIGLLVIVTLGTGHTLPVEAEPARCFPHTLFAKELGDVTKGGANLMLELGGAIFFVCAGLPVLCCLAMTCYVRCCKERPHRPGPRGVNGGGSGYGTVADQDDMNDGDGECESGTAHPLVSATELQHDPYDTPAGSVRPTPRYARTASEHANNSIGKGPGHN